jgi:hypothetical protein
MFSVLLCSRGYGTCGWQVKLGDPIKHGTLLESFENLYIVIALCKYSNYITKELNYVVSSLLVILSCSLFQFIDETEQKIMENRTELRQS